MDYFRLLMQNLQDSSDPVIIYESARCIHELIKEIDQQIQSQEREGKQIPNTFLFGADSAPENEQEEQIKLSISINRQINYA